MRQPLLDGERAWRLLPRKRQRHADRRIPPAIFVNLGDEQICGSCLHWLPLYLPL